MCSQKLVAPCADTNEILMEQRAYYQTNIRREVLDRCRACNIAPHALDSVELLYWGIDATYSMIHYRFSAIGEIKQCAHTFRFTDRFWKAQYKN